MDGDDRGTLSSAEEETRARGAIVDLAEIHLGDVRIERLERAVPRRIEDAAADLTERRLDGALEREEAIVIGLGIRRADPGEHLEALGVRHLLGARAIAGTVGMHRGDDGLVHRARG